MKRSLYILRLVMVVMLPLLMVLAPAKAQTVVYQGSTTPLGVVQNPGDNYEWEIYSDLTVDFAKVSGNCPVATATFLGGNTGSTVDVQWLATGIYFFKVTARDAIGCAMNFKIGMIKVIPFEVKAIITGNALTGACSDVALDGSTSIGNNLVYEWKTLDGGQVSNVNGVTTRFVTTNYTGTLPADLRVQLKVTNDKGFTDSDTITIKIDQRAVAKVFSTNVLEKDGSMIVDGSVSTGTGLTYKWSTNEGKIIGANNVATVNLYGAGIYLLEITDSHGCTDKKSFTFPLDPHQIIARPDYARTSWAKDTTINVLANDMSTDQILPGSVKVVEQPARGTVKVNADGTITYSPKDRRAGRDAFVYQVCDNLNNCATATVTVDLYDSGIIATEGFSPNGDGINDVLVFGDLDRYTGSSLYIYTRSGQLVYQSDNYKNDWDGRTIGSTATSQNLVPSGTYYYILKLGGTNRSLKGFIYVGY